MLGLKEADALEELATSVPSVADNTRALAELQKMTAGLR